MAPGSTKTSSSLAVTTCQGTESQRRSPGFSCIGWALGFPLLLISCPDGEPRFWHIQTGLEANPPGLGKGRHPKNPSPWRDLGMVLYFGERVGEAICGLLHADFCTPKPFGKSLCSLSLFLPVWVGRRAEATLETSFINGSGFRPLLSQ